MDGYIKIHRKFLEWEWYDDTNTKSVFLHLLLNANIKPSRYRGLEVQAGSLICGEDSLANQLSMTRQQIRTALKKLESTGEITRKSTNKFSIVTICKWSNYQAIMQDEQDANNQQATNKQPTDNQQTTNKQPTSNQQITTEGEYKNIRRKEYKNIDSDEKSFSPPLPLIDDNVLSGEFVLEPEKPTITAQQRKEEKEKKCAEKEKDFQEMLRPYLEEYGRDMLNEFYLYWSEWNKSKTKMRWEQQPTWDTARRLAKWASNSFKFDNNFNQDGTGTRQRRAGLSDCEVIEAVSAGIGLHLAKQQNS